MDKVKAEKINAEIAQLEDSRVELNKVFANLESKIVKGDAEAKKLNDAYQIFHKSINALIVLFKDEVK